MELALKIIILLAPILIVYRFQSWMNRTPNIDPDQLETRLAGINWMLIGLLILPAFAPDSWHRQKIVHATLGLTIFAMLWIQKIRAQRRPEVSTKGAFVFEFRKYAFLFSMMFFIVVANQLLSPYLTSLGATFVSLTLMVYATPLMVRIMFSVLKMEPSSLRQKIEGIFTRAGSPIGQIYIIQTGGKPFSNAMVCGSRFGVGPFKRSLLITADLFEKLDEDEITAVISHEASHLRLRHIPKRMLFAFFAYLLSMVAVTVPFFLICDLFNLLNQGSVTAMIAMQVFMAIVFQQIFVMHIVRRQEFEADLEAVKLGAEPNALVSSLRKLTEANLQSRKKKKWLMRLALGAAHPSLEERAEAIYNRAAPVEKLPFLNWRAAGVYAVFMIALVTAWNFSRTQNRKLDRGIASSESNDEPK